MNKISTLMALTLLIFMISANAGELTKVDEQYGDLGLYETFLLKSKSEQCRYTLLRGEKIIDTSCLRITNSKDKKIVCTKTKKICKTTQELFDFANEVNEPIDHLDENEEACNNGNAKECYKIAQSYDGFLEAPGYYNKACEGGHARACYELASIYELGNRAVQKDLELSKKYYRMACKSGYNDACIVIKKMNERSKNITKKSDLKLSSMGLKRIDPNSNVLIGDNSAMCMVVAKQYYSDGVLRKTSTREKIGYGKFSLSGMTKSVIYFHNRTYRFVTELYDDKGVKTGDQYRFTTRNGGYQDIFRYANLPTTILGLTVKDKILMMECYYTR